MASVKALFYLPLKDNDGRELTEEIEDARTELYARFGGWTFQGYVQGAFRMPDGSQSMDVSAAYVVILDESRLETLEEVLRRFRERTLQAVIYLEIQRDVEMRFVK
jgi:hypothetical protein